LKELTLLDVHEGAEAPIVGAVAAVAGFASSIGTNTADFSDRLKKPKPGEILAAAEKASDIRALDEKLHRTTPNAGQLEILAQRMARKTCDDNLAANLRTPQDLQSQMLVRLRTQDNAKRAQQGRAHQIACATGRYTTDVSRTCLKGGSLINVSCRKPSDIFLQHQWRSSTTLLMASAISHLTLLRTNHIEGETTSLASGVVWL
jgi:hypothetical protein